MDLRNNKITIGELLSHPKARAIAQREFPQLAASPMMMRMASMMTLQQALGYAGGLEREQVDRILRELSAI